MNAILGEAFGSIEAQMHFRVARQAALAANLANADTPNYRRVDLRFDAALQDATSRLRSTDPSHRLHGGDGPYRVVRGPRGERPDGNGVQLDQELIQTNRNAGAFMDLAGVLARLTALRRTAIGGGA